jgi:hypothetical protein
MTTGGAVTVTKTTRFGVSVVCDGPTSEAVMVDQTAGEVARSVAVA